MNRPNQYMANNSNMQRRGTYQPPNLPRRTYNEVTVNTANANANPAASNPYSVNIVSSNMSESVPSHYEANVVSANAVNMNAPMANPAGAVLSAATDCLDKLPVAMAYVPWQNWESVYEPDRALERGTLFPPLDLPFLRGGRAV